MHAPWLIPIPVAGCTAILPAMLLVLFTVELPEVVDDVSVLGVLKVPEKAVPALVEVDPELSCPFVFVPPLAPILDEVDDVLQSCCISEPVFGNLRLG